MECIGTHMESMGKPYVMNYNTFGINGEPSRIDNEDHRKSIGIHMEIYEKSNRIQIKTNREHIRFHMEISRAIHWNPYILYTRKYNQKIMIRDVIFHEI